MVLCRLVAGMEGTQKTSMSALVNKAVASALADKEIDVTTVRLPLLVLEDAATQRLRAADNLWIEARRRIEDLAAEYPR